MPTVALRAVLLVLGSGLLSSSSTAVESQALGTVAALPEAITQVFACGSWADQGKHGYFRIVLVTVSGGAGAEVYIQRIVESPEGSNQVRSVLATVPVRELNNDHAQYAVLAARCAGNNSVELRATFEHDSGDAERRIRLKLVQDGRYRMSNVVARKPRLPAAAAHGER